MTAKCMDLTQPISFTCTYQGFAGELAADVQRCVFTSSFLHTEIKWSDVKSILLKTKPIKDEPRSVILIRTTRQGSLSERFLGASKHYFYNFNDIVEVIRVLQELKDANTAASISEHIQSPPRDDDSSKKKNNQTDSNTLNSNMDGRTRSHVTEQAFHSVRGVNGAQSNDGLIAAGRKSDGRGMSSPRSISRRHRERPTAVESIHGTESPKQNAVSIPHKNSNTPNSVQRTVIDIPSRPVLDDNGLVMSPPRFAQVGVPFSIRTDKRPSMRRAANVRRKNNMNGNGNGEWRHLPTGQPNKSAEVVQSRRRLMIAFTISALVVVVLFSALAPRVHEPSAQEVVQCVFDGLEQLRRWRITRQNDGLDTGAASLRQGLRAHSPYPYHQQQSPMRRATLCVSPRAVSDGVAELLKQYVATQRDLVRLRVQRVQRENGDLNNVLAVRRAAVATVAIASSSKDKEDTNDDNNGEGHGLAGQLHAQHPTQQENSPQAKIQKYAWATRVAMDARWYGSAVWSVFDFFFGALKGAARRFPWLSSEVKSSPVRHSTTFVSSNAPSSSSSSYSSAAASSVSDITTQYAEILLDGHIVSEQVTVDDAIERRTCLRLSRELIRIEQLLRELLLEYQDVVMAPQYEALLQRIGSSAIMSRESDTSTRGKKDAKRVRSDAEWISLLATGGMGVGLGPDMPMMHHTELLEVIMLRRHAIALLGMDPFSQETRLRVPDTDTEPSGRNPNRNRDHRARQSSDDREVRKEKLMEILEDFVKSTTKATGARTLAAGPAAVLRNIAYELKYWHEHEEDWQSFVLLRLANMSSGPGSDEIDGTADVPIFRGLWCFMERPIEVPVPKRKPMATSKDSSQTSEKEEKKGSGAQNERGAAIELSCTALEKGDALFILKGFMNAEDQCPADDQSQTKPNAQSLSHSAKAPPQQKQSQQQPQQPLLKKEQHGKEPRHSDSEDEAVRDSADENKSETEDENIRELEADVMERRLRVVARLSSLVHLRWVDALDLFLRAHGAYRTKTPETARDRSGLGGSQAPGTEEDDDSAVAFSWRRLMQFMLRADQEYGPFIAAGIAPLSAALAYDTKAFDTRAASDRMLSAFSSWLWPQSPRPLRRWLYMMQRTDPAVRRLRRDLLHMPLGEMEDVPWMLLNAMTVPVNALRLQCDALQIFRVSCVALVVVLAIFLALILGPF